MPSSWDDMGPLMDTSVGVGVTDPSNNASAGQSAETHNVQLPTAQAKIDFENDAGSTWPWGVATYAGTDPGVNPACESGGCMIMSDVQIGPCAASRSGFAGRVTAGTKLTIRYRVEAAAPTIYQPFYLTLFTHEASGGIGVGPDVLTAPMLTPLDSVQGTYGSAWTIVEVPLPTTTAAEIGFSIHAGGVRSCGFEPQPVAGSLVVESIAVQ